MRALLLRLAGDRLVWLALAALAMMVAGYQNHVSGIREDERNAVAVERAASNQKLERDLRNAQSDNLDAAGRGDVRDRLRDPDATFFIGRRGLRDADTDTAPSAQ